MSSQTMFASKGIELLRELKRTEALPEYNHEIVNQVILECKNHHQMIRDTLEQYTAEERKVPAINAGLLIHQKSILRNKRVLLAYLQERQARLRKMRWETGPVIPASSASHLSEPEEEFFQEYHQLLNSYVAKHPIPLSNIYSPPKALYVEVRVMKDIGQIATENGILDLEKDTTHFMLRSEAEALLKTGVLELL